jgi:hypothetical protein
MRVIALLPATCLALLATSGLAQQAAPPPSPSSGQATGAGEKALPPAAQPASQPGTEPPRAGADAPWGIERQVPRGELPTGMSFAPTLHLRYRGFVLDLPCSADVDTATCAKIALGIIDHLRQGNWGGNNDDIRRDRGDRGHRDRGDRGRSRGDRDDYDESDDSQ